MPVTAVTTSNLAELNMMIILIDGHCRYVSEIPLYNNINIVNLPPSGAEAGPLIFSHTHKIKFGSPRSVEV
jgi:hypothetical protein